MMDSVLPCHRSSPIQSCSSPTVRGCFLPACPGRCPGEGEEQSAEREGEQMVQLEDIKMPMQQMKMVLISHFLLTMKLLDSWGLQKRSHYFGSVTLR